jgi:hypothetical protein
MNALELDEYIPTLRKKFNAFKSTKPLHNTQYFSALLNSRHIEDLYKEILLEEYKQNTENAFNRGYQRGVTETLKRPHIKVFNDHVVSSLQKETPEMNIAEFWYHLDEFDKIIYQKIHNKELASEFQSPMYMMSLFMFDLGFKIGIQNQISENCEPPRD